MSSSKEIKLSIEPRITSSELSQCLRIKDRIVKEQGPGLSCGHSQCLELRPRRRNPTQDMTLRQEEKQEGVTDCVKCH